MLRAASSDWRKAASLTMSGRGAPARTATATAECTRSVRLPATAWPEASSLSMASAASTTRSKASPAATRLAASTPPTDSKLTSAPHCPCQAAARSASSKRVAIEEMPVRRGVGMAGSGLKRGGLWAAPALPTTAVRH